MTNRDLIESLKAWDIRAGKAAKKQEYIHTTLIKRAVAALEAGEWQKGTDALPDDEVLVVISETVDPIMWGIDGEGTAVEVEDTEIIIRQSGVSVVFSETGPSPADLITALILAVQSSDEFTMPDLSALTNNQT